MSQLASISDMLTMFRSIGWKNVRIAGGMSERNEREFRKKRQRG